MLVAPHRQEPCRRIERLSPSWRDAGERSRVRLMSRLRLPWRRPCRRWHCAPSHCVATRSASRPTLRWQDRSLANPRPHLATQHLQRAMPTWSERPHTATRMPTAVSAAPRTRVARATTTSSSEESTAGASTPPSPWCKPTCRAHRSRTSRAALSDRLARHETPRSHFRSRAGHPRRSAPTRLVGPRRGARGINNLIRAPRFVQRVSVNNPAPSYPSRRNQGPGHPSTLGIDSFQSQRAVRDYSRRAIPCARDAG